MNCSEYFQNALNAIRTIAAGLRVTLPYFFARSIVLQYPEVEPAVQPRFRGFHAYEIERCIACEACARICPADCITVARSAPRKMDKERDIAVGGAVTQFSIDHSTCLFCALCQQVCPTGCLTLSTLHDNSCYRRADLMADYIALAKAGRRTIEPIWLTKPKLQEWAAKVRGHWRNLDSDRRELMACADDPDYCRSLAKMAAAEPEREK